MIYRSLSQITEVQFHNRRAVSVQNDILRVTCTIEGGHLAEIQHKTSGINPLWTPPWPSIEPSTYDFSKHPEYGAGNEAHLLSGILGHNICLDTFGSPSPEESAAGIPVHGEGPLIPYEVSAQTPSEVTLRGHLKLAQLRFTRRLKVNTGAPVVLISESIENLSPSDRPIAWTQHVTLGPPFLESGKTQFRITATRSQVGNPSFNENLGPYVPDAEFLWPQCPLKNGGTENLETFTKGPVSGGFTTHLMDRTREQAFFVAWAPASKVVFGYVWKRIDFPWLARWDEHYLRTAPPWNGKAMTCGMEFGVSPFVGSRREMVDRGTLFGVSGFRWLPAHSKMNAEYCAFITNAPKIPESVTWDGAFGIELS